MPERTDSRWSSCVRDFKLLNISTSCFVHNAVVEKCKLTTSKSCVSALTCVFVVLQTGICITFTQWMLFVVLQGESSSGSGFPGGGVKRSRSPTPHGASPPTSPTAQADITVTLVRKERYVSQGGPPNVSTTFIRTVHPVTGLQMVRVQILNLSARDTVFKGTGCRPPAPPWMRPKAGTQVRSAVQCLAACSGEDWPGRCVGGDKPQRGCVETRDTSRSVLHFHVSWIHDDGDSNPPDVARRFDAKSHC